MTLISINLMIYILLNVFPSMSAVLLLDSSPGSAADKPWTLITVLFSHEMLIHVLVNMMLVFVFGTHLVRETNARVMYGIYILCGLIGSGITLGYLTFVDYDGGPIAGASAAAFGIVAAYAAIHPDKTILKSSAKNWMIALFIANALLTVRNPQISVGGPAHAAGLVIGFFFGKSYMRKVRRERPMNETGDKVKSVGEKYTEKRS